MKVKEKKLECLDKFLDIHHLRDQLNRQKNEREHFEQEATSLVRKVSTFYATQADVITFSSVNY